MGWNIRSWKRPFKESIFSWSHFQRPFCPLAFFYTPGLVHTLLQSNNDRVAYIESSTTNTLRSQWIDNGRISRRTVNRRLNSAWFRARRPIKRPLLTIRHKTARLQESFSETFLSFGVLLHSRFGSHAASIEQ
jgi:hypothetical protein